MVLEENTSHFEFDIHDDLVQITWKPSKPPKYASEATGKVPKAENSKRKRWGSRLFFGILKVWLIQTLKVYWEIFLGLINISLFSLQSLWLFTQTFMLGSFIVLNLLTTSDTVCNVAKLWCLGDVDIYFLVMHSLCNLFQFVCFGRVFLFIL